MVCSVADKASTQRLEQSSLEVVRLEEMRKAGAMESEASLKAELAKTNAVVASLKADIGVARAWQTGVDNLEVKLMARIEELRTMAEVRLWDRCKWEKPSYTSTSFQTPYMPGSTFAQHDIYFSSQDRTPASDMAERLSQSS